MGQPLTDEVRAAIKQQLTTPPAPPKRRGTIIASDRKTRQSMTGGTGGKFWSESLGVPPEQIAEAKEDLRMHGINAEFNEDGCIRIESTKQHRDIAKAIGMWSGRDGYEAQGLSGRRPRQEFERGREQVRRECEGY